MFLKSRLGQWEGLVFAFGNVLFIANKVNEMSHLFLHRSMPDLISGKNIGLVLVGQIALIIGYVAYYQFYAQRARRSARYALRLFSGGGSLVALGHLSFLSLPLPWQPYTEIAFVFVLIGMLVLLIGLIWFGVLNFRQPLLKRWRWVPFFTGLMGFFGFFLFAGEEITAVFLLFRTLFALGLIGLGLILWREKPIPTEVLDSFTEKKFVA